MLAPLLHDPHDLLDEHMMAYVLVVGGWLPALLFGTQRAQCGASPVPGHGAIARGDARGGLVAAVLLAIGTAGDASRRSRLIGRFGVGGFLVCAPVLWPLPRGLRRVRWRDPASPPDEREPPARREDVSRRR